MKSEAEIVNFTEERQKRASGKPRQGRMPAVVNHAVALIKSAEREALLKALSVPDPGVAELLRCAAVAYDNAAKMVLVAFDEVSRKPSV